MPTKINTTVDSTTQEASSNQAATRERETKVVLTINAWTVTIIICAEVVVASAGAEANLHPISMMVRITVALEGEVMASIKEVVSTITTIREADGAIMAMGEATITTTIATITRTTTTTVTIRIITTLEASATIVTIITEAAGVVAAATITEAASTIVAGATTTTIIISTTKGPSTHITLPKVGEMEASMHLLLLIERTMEGHKGAITTTHRLIESSS